MFVVDAANKQLTTVNVSTVQMVQPAMALPGGASADVADGTLAVSTTEGDVWVGASDAASTLAPTERDPDVELGGGGAVAVGRDGRVVAVSSVDGSVSVLSDGGGESEMEVAETGLGVEPGAGPGEVQASMSGNRPVVLDRRTQMLVLGDGETVDVSSYGSEVELQLPGDDDGVVLLATERGLLSVPTGGGEPTWVYEGDHGAAIRPVRIAGCSYGAWTGAPFESVVCDGNDVITKELDAAPEGLRFRVNRNHVILNELRDGKIWYVVDGEIRDVQRWEESLPKNDPNDQPDDDDGPKKDPSLSEENKRPDAIDDTPGARPGVASTLTVLDNDVDENADILVITSVDDVPDELKVSIINQGQALQVEPPAGATSPYSFSYTITDGREEPNSDDTATVSLRLTQDGENAPPELKPDKPAASFSVESQKSASYDVLQDWWDPDGDPIYLESAAVTAGLSDTVQTLPSGLLTFSDSGLGTGAKQVDVTVRDAPPVALTPAESNSGQVQVVVEAPLTRIKPVARPDYRAMVVGATAVIEPLANDSDANGDVLHVAKLLNERLLAERITASLSAVDDTISVTATEPGSYVFGYEVTDGLDSVPGLIRVDVAAPEKNTPPSAGADLVVLPNQASAQRTVDLLANDVDLDGDVLVVRSLSVSPGAAVSAQLLEHRRLRVSATAELITPVLMTYVVSDGQSDATGQVVVVSAPSSALNKPPVLGVDSVTVRAGDIVSIPVLSNDIDPEGDDLQITRLVEPPEADQGLAFVSGATVRFLAPDTPMTVRMTYEATDGAAGNNLVSGQIVVTVRADGDNSEPTARTVEARVLAGSSVRITIPLAGIDPDGDSVRLDGLGTQAATLGRVVTPVGTDSVVYEAFPSGGGGTDSFSYRVTDSRGASAEGVVRVGVAPRPTTNGPPVAGIDRVEIRPDGEALVPVLANDYDPDGDAISFGDPALERAPEGVTAEVDGAKVRITAPDQVRQVQPLVYRITDRRGGQAFGTIEIVVTDDARGLPPIARDDEAKAPADPTASTVEIDVTKNDDDPDGAKDDLTVTVAGSTSGQRLVVELRDQPRVVAYTITDDQDLSATAVVRVPAKGSAVDRPPTQKRGVGPLEVKNGETLTIKIADVVEDPEGKPVRLTTGSAASATHHDGSDVVKDETTLVFAPKPGYAGAASITFEVTDGDAADTGNRVVISLPITVVSDAANTPPSLDGGGSLDVAPGEDAVTLDLRQLVTDPDDGDLEQLEFDIVDESTAPDGVRATLPPGSSVISVEDAGDAKVGTDGAVTVSVTDDKSDPVTFSVGIRVVQSSRPQPTCTQAVIDKADVGTTVSRNVLEDCFNPFPDTALKLSGATTESRFGSVTSTGDTIEFTAAKGFVGNGLVRYKVLDRADRVADGSITVVIRDVPGKPSPPTVLEVASRRVLLTWQPPAPNGSPIDYYTVKSSHGSTRCDATTCEIDGLKNDSRYQFTVTAHNEVGDGEPSERSAEARPDQKPEAPTNVALAFDKAKLDGQLTATWTKAANEGSPITAYEIQISPPPASGPQTQVLGAVTSYTWTGLTNGTSYRVKVRAINAAATGPGDWSADSNSEVPAKVPDQPVITSVSRVNDPLGELIEVRWTTPKDNGAKISAYKLEAIKEGTTTPAKTLPSLSGTAVSQVVDVDDVRAKYAFRLTATNKAGDSIPSGLSVPVQAEREPAVIGAINVNDRTGIIGLNGRLDISFQRPDDGGLPLSRYEVRVNGAARSFTSDLANPNPTLSVTSLANGTPYRFEIRACNPTFCQRAYSAQTAERTPYGPVGTPPVSAGKPNFDQVSFNWGPPAANGQVITGMEISINGGGWQGVAVNGGTVVGNGRNQDYSIRVRAVDAAGQRTPDGAHGTASARTNPPPSIVASIGGGLTAWRGTCRPGDSNWIQARLSNFTPDSTVRVGAYQTVGEPGDYGVFHDVRINGAGNAELGDGFFCVGSTATSYVYSGGTQSNTV